MVLTPASLNPFVVLPTVVSRCQRLFFHPVPAPEIERLLLKLDVEPGRARLLAELSRGRPGWTLRVAGGGRGSGPHQESTPRLAGGFGAPPPAPLRGVAQPCRWPQAS